MKTITKVNKGKKVTQVITKTPVQGKKNRKGNQYYVTKTTYIKNKINWRDLDSRNGYFIAVLIK